MKTGYIPVALVGFVAGMFGSLVAGRLVAPALAQPQARLAVAAGVAARRIMLVDAAGATRAELAMSPDGAPGLFFYDTHGINRLVLGVYAPAESEYPFVVLNDTGQRAAAILRLYGAHESPVLVLKHGGADRSIYGLNAVTLEPFVVNIGTDGRRSPVFGQF